MNLTEQLLLKRQKFLISSAMGFFLWQGGMLLKELFPADDTVVSIAVAMTLAGAFQWAMFSFNYAKYVRKAKPVHDSLNGELTRENRAKASAFGYIVLFGSVGLFLAVNTILKSWTSFSQINGAMFIHGLFIAGFVCPILYFVWLERK